MKITLFNRKNLFILVAAVLAAVVVWNSGNDLTHLKPHHGGTHYLDMLQGLKVPAPFAYRILVPLLSFGSVTLGYVWMAIGMFFTAWGLFRLTGLVGGDVRARWFAMLLFLLWAETGWVVTYWYILPDPVAWACLTWAIVWALRGRYLEAFVILAFGVLSRELCLLGLAVIAAVLPRDRRKLLWWGLLPIAFFLILVLAVPAGHAISPNDTLNPLKMFTATLKANQGKLFTWPGFWAQIYLVVLFAAAGYFGLRDKRLLWAFLPLIGVFFGTDTQRMIVFTLPVLLPMAGLGLATVSKCLPKPHAALFVVAILALHSANFQQIWLMILLAVLIPLFPALTRRNLRTP